MADDTQNSPKNNLAMYLAGGLCDDLYPWDLVLEEGFSRLYRGELTVLSEKKHRMADLSGLLDKGISLALSQRLGDAKTVRTRYLHGIVTEIRNAGVFSNGKVEDCYSYILVIEPELARLKFTRFTAPYYRMNPPEIFDAVLNKYGLKARIDQTYISRTKYGKDLFFDQSDASDLDFIKSIAGLYGISFTFAHPKSPPDALGAPVLYFSDGEKFPLSDIVYSDKREEPRTAAFDFISADESRNIWKMDGWTRAKAIGVDGFYLNATYPQTNYRSEQWKRGKTNQGERYITVGRLFHSYDRNTGPAKIDEDLRLILDVRQRAEEEAKSRWTAAADNLSLRPGLILELAHFYGMNDQEHITALVTGSVLHHRSRWPSYLAVRVEDGDGELTEVRGNCMDWSGGEEKRYCPGQ
jgi:uncharacterized protein involved in type VI secretion and phage assembly